MDLDSFLQHLSSGFKESHVLSEEIEERITDEGGGRQRKASLPFDYQRQVTSEKLMDLYEEIIRNLGKKGKEQKEARPEQNQPRQVEGEQ